MKILPGLVSGLWSEVSRISRVSTNSSISSAAFTNLAVIEPEVGAVAHLRLRYKKGSQPEVDGSRVLVSISLEATSKEVPIVSAFVVEP